MFELESVQAIAQNKLVILRMEALYNVFVTFLAIIILGSALVMLFRTAQRIRSRKEIAHLENFHRKVCLVFCYYMMFVVSTFLIVWLYQVCSFGLWLRILQPSRYVMTVLGIH